MRSIGTMSCLRFNNLNYTKEMYLFQETDETIFVLWYYFIMIESINNNKIKEYTKLHQKKDRDKQGLFLVEGEHMVQEALRANILKDVFIREDYKTKIDFPYEITTQQVMNKLSRQNSNAKIIGVCIKQNKQIQNPKKVILLDNVQDPGNVGTIIRTAHSFGLDAVYLSKDCADIYNPKTLQSTQGALFHIPCIVQDLKETINTLKLPVYATALHQEHINLQDTQNINEYALVMGNEGNGIRDEILELSNHIIQIEMETFESLNVAIAASICMYMFQYKK